jgi:hypothetical protein
MLIETVFVEELEAAIAVGRQISTILLLDELLQRKQMSAQEFESLQKGNYKLKTQTLRSL